MSRRWFGVVLWVMAGGIAHAADADAPGGLAAYFGHMVTAAYVLGGLLVALGLWEVLDRRSAGRVRGSSFQLTPGV
ncbi:MAG: hypothetical protein AB1758_16925, partial [Candidatus Eremiobacterota bacterium]